MNRRSFFKVVTGFVAGIFATSVKAKEKPQLTVAMLKKARDELVLNQMERLRIEATEKAANSPYVLHYADDTNMTTYERGIYTPPGTLWIAK